MILFSAVFVFTWNIYMFDNCNTHILYILFLEKNVVQENTCAIMVLYYIDVVRPIFNVLYNHHGNFIRYIYIITFVYKYNCLSFKFLFGSFFFNNEMKCFNERLKF